jgi:hypothetical protein
MNDSQRANHTPEKKLQHRIYTLNKLATYFEIAKATLREASDMSEELLYSPLLDNEHGLYTKFYCVHVDPKSLSLSILCNGKKFAKTRLYEDFLIGEALSNGDEYALALHLSENDIYVMYRAELYEGYGGIFIKTVDGEFVLEPIGNYLRARHPKHGEDPI